MFEKFIFTKLTHHLSVNHILSNEQFGFRKKLPLDSASFKLINGILSSLNNKIIVG